MESPSLGDFKHKYNIHENFKRKKAIQRLKQKLHGQKHHQEQQRQRQQQQQPRQQQQANSKPIANKHSSSGGDSGEIEPETFGHGVVLVVVVLVFVFVLVGRWGGGFRRNKNLSSSHCQLQLGPYKQEHATDKPSITKPDPTRYAGKAGGYVFYILACWTPLSEIHFLRKHVFAFERQLHTELRFACIVSDCIARSGPNENASCVSYPTGWWCFATMFPPMHRYLKDLNGSLRPAFAAQAAITWPSHR